MLLAVAVVLSVMFAWPAGAARAQEKPEKNVQTESKFKERQKPARRVVVFVTGALAVSKSEKGNVTSATITGEDGTACALGSFSLTQDLKDLDGKQVMTKGVMEDEKGKQVLRVISKIKPVLEKKTGGDTKKRCGDTKKTGGRK